MLSYDALIEQAKIRGMPSAKIRGVLREYIQILILKQIYNLKTENKLYFTGGTYLRLLHNAKRFSEDLDFYTCKMLKEEFENLMSRVQKELKRVGLKAKVTFKYWQSMYVSTFLFPDIEKFYNVTSRYSKKQGIIIKVEVNKTEKSIKTESLVISGFGEFYPCVCTTAGILFADKIDAFTKKDRGRHLYDIIFMLSNKYPVDREFLTSLGITNNPLKVILIRIKKISKDELRKQAEILKPFLFEESESDLIINAHSLLPSLIEQYRKSERKE